MTEVVRGAGLFRVVCGIAVALFIWSAACHAQITIQVPAQAATIQAGIDLVADGDTVQVAPGTYNENIDFEGKSILVTSGASSFSGASSTVINSAGKGPTVTFGTGESSRAVLNGFTIMGGRSNAANCSYGGGVYVNGASPTISNNQVLNNEGYGILVTGASSPLIQGNDIKGNHFSNTSLPIACNTAVPIGSGEGIDIENVLAPQIIGNTIEENREDTSRNSGGAGISVLDAQELIIANNIIRNNIGDGNSAITIAAYFTRKLTLVQNLIYGNINPNAPTIQVSIAGGITQASAPILEEINNTIYGGGQGLLFYFASSTIENNILYSPDPNPSSTSFSGGLVCADPESQQSPLLVQNNDIYVANPIPMYACPSGSGNLAVDPGLVNPSQDDYHEQASSPTIDVGTLSTPDIPAADLDGTARTVCGKIDMGAYELRPIPPVSIASSINPAPGGSPITFTSHVTGNCNEPTGTITFLDAGNPIGTAALNGSATASLNTALLVVGQHNITANYPGDFNFQASTSPILVQVITGDPTMTTVSVSPNPAAAYSTIIFSSNVSSIYGIPTGLVTFTAGGATLATAHLNAAGVASTTVTSLGAGTYEVVANYTADTRFQPSSSASLREVVTAMSSATSLTASPNPAAVTQTVMFSVTVRAIQGTIVPRGNVSFSSDGSALGTATLDAKGTASISTSTLLFGDHHIVATYTGSSNFNASSASLTEAISLVGTQLALAATPNPANTGQAVVLTASMKAAIAGMIPTGSVTFLDGSTVLGSAMLNDQGESSFTTSSLGVGTHSLTATYAANAYFGASTSAIVAEVVQAYDFSVSSTPASITLPPGEYTILSVTVAPIGGFAETVSLSCSAVPDHTQCTFPQGSTFDLGSGSKTVQVAVSTSDIYGYGRLVQNARSTPPLLQYEQVWFACLFLPGVGLLAGARKRWTILNCTALLILSAAAMLSLQGCSSKQPGYTAPGTYTLQFVGYSTGSSTIHHTAVLQLVVPGTTGQ